MNKNEIALRKATEFLDLEFQNETQKKAKLQCMFLEMLSLSNVDSKTLIKLATEKYEATKHKNYDRRSYLNGFADGFVSAKGDK